jgi:hypothetical protein
MNKRTTILIVLLMMSAFGGLRAQTNDAQLWISADVEKKFTPRLSLLLSEELRMDENMTEAGTIFSDLGVSYDIFKGLNVSANYRFINKRRLDDTYSSRLRYYFDLTYKYAPKPVIITLRARYQSQYSDFLKSEDGKIPENYERTKLKVAFDSGKHFRPFLASEMYIPLSNSSSSFMIDCMRYQAGVDYKFNKHHSLTAYYMIQKEMNIADPDTDYVIGLGYSFVF